MRKILLSGSQRSLVFPNRKTTPIPSPYSSRLLDMIPGGWAWSGLVFAVLSAYGAPVVALWAAAALAVYLTGRFVLAAGAALWGLRRVRQWEALDWAAEYARRASASSLPREAIHHVVIIPNYQEDLSILRRTLDHLAAQYDAKTSISVVLAMEIRETQAASKSTLLRSEYSDHFEHFFVFFHPKDIPGETACKSANLTWAARLARRALVDQRGYIADHLLVTVMDADTLWHPHYFESLTALFATCSQRYTTFWQAPIRYHGNVWAIRAFMRLLHAYSSAWELAYLAAPWWQALPMSSYSASLRLLHDVGYWDPDAIADEWHMYLKGVFHHAGPVRLCPVYLPFLANATTGNTVGQALKERYLQTLRHAWGAKEISYTIHQMRTHPQTPFWRGAGLLLRVAHDNLLAGFGWIVLLLGAQLPMLFHPDITRAAFHTPPFILLQTSAAIMTGLTVGLWLMDLAIRPPRPTAWTIRARLAEIMSLLLLTVLTFCCVALPVLHAQTRLLLGLPLEFRVSAKT